MKDKIKRRPFSQWINERLREPDGQTFKDGKWRFWFPAVFLLSALNAAMTGWIFGSSGGVQASIVSVVIAVGGLACWLAVGNLHYSDSSDAAMARGVSLLDSATLVFVIAHFCFLLWALGHLVTLRAAESKYEAQVRTYNTEARSVSSDNVAIARSAEKIAEQTTQAERLRRQAAYQMRRAAEAGARIRVSAPRSLAPSLSTAPVELERPKAPAESSVAFLVKWDSWIRLANFGELILAAITLIYIRNRSAAFNAKNAPQVNYGSAMGIPAPVAALRQDSRKIAAGVATDLDRLRAYLKEISFYHPGRWFKVDPLESGDGLWVRFCERRRGREKTIAKVKWNNKVFAELNRPDFTERLTQRLIDAGFPIGGE